jgi:hypothetical protein
LFCSVGPAAEIVLPVIREFAGEIVLLPATANIQALPSSRRSVWISHPATSTRLEQQSESFPDIDEWQVQVQVE